MAIEHKTIYRCDRCGNEKSLPADGRMLKLERATHTYRGGGMVSYGVITAGSVTIGGSAAPKETWLCADCVEALDAFLHPQPDFTAGPEHPAPILPCARGCPACHRAHNTGHWRKAED